MSDAFQEEKMGCFCNSRSYESMRRCRDRCDFGLNTHTVMSSNLFNTVKICGQTCREDSIEERARFNSSISNLNSRQFTGPGFGFCSEGTELLSVGSVRFTAAGQQISGVLSLSASQLPRNITISLWIKLEAASVGNLLDFLGFLRLKRIGTGVGALARLVWDITYINLGGTTVAVPNIGPTTTKCTLGIWCFIGISLYELPESRLPDGTVDYIVD